jgi:tetratricopeptide (TPR) repeat protein
LCWTRFRGGDRQGEIPCAAFEPWSRRRRRSKYHSTEAGEILYKGMYQYYKFEQCASVAARQYFEKFIRLEPDSVLGYIWMVNAWGFALMVRWEEPAIALRALRENVDKSFAIDADDAQALVGDTYYRNAGQFENAIDTFNTCLQQFPDCVYAHAGLVTTCSLMGDYNMAKREVEAVLAAAPGYSIERFTTPNFYRDKTIMDRSANALRQAGMPERWKNMRASREERQRIS